MELPKTPLSEALQIAENIVNLLKPYCEKIDIAGSIRRKKSEVKDIEIVCLPTVWQSEQEFFEWLGVKYVEPEERL